MTDIDEYGTRFVEFRETVWFDEEKRLAKFRDTMLFIDTEGLINGKQVVWQKHPVSKVEVERWLLRYGFEILHVYGNYDREEYSDSSDRAIFVARKI